MRREMARCRSLEPLYRTAMALLPELGISNDSIAYYAALVDYYTVQKLQQLKKKPNHSIFNSLALSDFHHQFLEKGNRKR